MSTLETDAVESTERIDPFEEIDFKPKAGKRACHEDFALEPDPGAGVVTVRNDSYGHESDEHEYQVTLDDRGVPMACTCPAFQYHCDYGEVCKHGVAVALARPVIEAAMGWAELVTDGGEERPEACTCEAWMDRHDLPCFACFREGYETVNPAVLDDEPTRHEPADFGHGESTGVIDL